MSMIFDKIGRIYFKSWNDQSDTQVNIICNKYYRWMSITDQSLHTFMTRLRLSKHHHLFEGVRCFYILNRIPSIKYWGMDVKRSVSKYMTKFKLSCIFHNADRSSSTDGRILNCIRIHCTLYSTKWSYVRQCVQIPSINNTKWELIGTYSMFGPIPCTSLLRWINIYEATFDSHSSWYVLCARRRDLESNIYLLKMFGLFDLDILRIGGLLQQANRSIQFK